MRTPVRDLTTSLQQRKKRINGQARVADDAADGSGVEFPPMESDDDPHPRIAGVLQHVVTAARPVNEEPIPLERPDDIAGRQRGKSPRHAPAISTATSSS